MKNEKKSMPLVYIYAVAIMVVVLGFVGWAFFTQPLADPRAPLAIFMTLFVGGYCSTVIVDDYVTKHNHRPFVSFGILFLCTALIFLVCGMWHVILIRSMSAGIMVFVVTGILAKHGYEWLK